jgi:hypothetical protein
MPHRRFSLDVSIKIGRQAGRRDRIPADATMGVSGKFHHDRHGLRRTFKDPAAREDRDPAARQCRMTSFERCFNVRRMYVSAIDDQKVFQPSQNMEFTVEQGTEIPRPQPGAFIAAQPSGKNLCRGVGALVVRKRHARTFEGDLAHHRVGETLASLRIANHDLVSRKAPPATRHGDLASFDRDGRRRIDLDRPPSFQTSMVERGSIGDSKMDWFTVSSNRNQKRVLGKSVARHHAVESTRPERGLEPGERCGPDWFGAVEGEFPR